MARCSWLESPQLSRQPCRPSRCAGDRSTPRACAPQPPGRCSESGPAPAQGQKPLTKGAQITFTRGQDHCEVVVGLLHSKTVARACFQGDSPTEATGAVRGYPPHSTLASSTLLHLYPLFRAHLRTQVPGNALSGRAGKSHGLVMPVPADFAAVLQEKRDQILLDATENK